MRTHRTSVGRVVYDRPRHVFSSRDLIRIARRMEMPSEVGQLSMLCFAIVELLVRAFLAWVLLIPFWDRWRVFFPVVRMWISDLWSTLTRNSEVPKEAQGSMRLQGGLSLL